MFKYTFVVMCEDEKVARKINGFILGNISSQYTNDEAYIIKKSIKVADEDDMSRFHDQLIADGYDDDEIAGFLK